MRHEHRSLLHLDGGDNASTSFLKTSAKSGERRRCAFDSTPITILTSAVGVPPRSELSMRVGIDSSNDATLQENQYLRTQLLMSVRDVLTIRRFKRMTISHTRRWARSAPRCHSFILATISHSIRHSMKQRRLTYESASVPN
jgi:hypothetical protein